MTQRRPSEESPPARVFSEIAQLGRRLERMRERALRETGLTPAQHYLLALLWQKDPRPFAELKELHRCSRATLTGVMDSLEKKGLVVRLAHPQDRRSLLAKLTPKGAALRGASSTSDEKFTACCCSSLDPGEFRTLARLLAKLGRSLPT